MMNIDFTEFDLKIGEVFPSLRPSELNAIKNRIETEIKNRRDNPDVFKKTRERIREIERKALTKLAGEKYIPLKKFGSQCSICSSFASDIQLLIGLGNSYNICSECVILIKEVIDGNKS